MRSHVCGPARDNLACMPTGAFDALAARIEQFAPSWQAEVEALLATDGETRLSSVTAGQVVGGLRGVIAVVCETSSVSAQAGLVIRGHPVLELTQLEPEEIFWLLLTGELPEAREVAGLTSYCADLAAVPEATQAMLRAFPPGSHPMVLLGAGLLSMRFESRFTQAYGKVPRAGLWRPALEDALTIFARLPALAGLVFRLTQGKVPSHPAEMSGPWSRRLATALASDSSGPPDGFSECLRLLAVVQSDHEGANACALAANAVGSALSDPFLALSAGLSALAGPVHGLASEMSLRFILDLMGRYGPEVSDARIIEECRARLASGQVIPGFGHAVLRVADPRFVALQRFARAAMPEDPVFRICEVMANHVPALLLAQGKAKNPWPNIDFISGPVLQHYGIRDARFLTVVFGVSLAIGVLAQFVVNRAHCLPILRPRSISLADLGRLCQGPAVT